MKVLHSVFGKEREYKGYTKKKDHSYDPTKLIKSVNTKVGKRSEAAIKKAIDYQLAHGVRLANRQTGQAQTPRFKGKFINTGTAETLTKVNVGLVQSIQQKYLDDLRLLIARTVGGGTLTFGQLVKEIKKLGKLNDMQAERIARTEVIRTVTAGMGDLYRATGYTKWKWVTAKDDRVCPICRPLDEKCITIGQPFVILPSGPIYKPPAHPNCRCGVDPCV
jgi:SPP1 gp7 family putative phage head morphogenesis protein